MGISAEQFTQQLVESGLVPADELQSVCAELPNPKKDDVQQLAREFVRRKLLTAYQAQQVYQGKAKQLVLGNYAILDKLGQGGMGLVVKALHRRMKRIVALKMLSPKVTASPETMRRFQREVEAAARLSHPNIVAAFDADEANGTHFLVLEYVEGRDLSVLVQEKGPLTVDLALDFIAQAALGLEYAHSRGVVHRDIKPSNLLVDSTGALKILDMGLARLESAGAQQDQLTGTGQIMGTVDFMAPEQAMDTKHADARADIYSLGVTLWYALTAKAMYDGETAVQKLMAHQQRPIPDLRAACPAVGPTLEGVFRRMVAKTPEERYQSMSEVLADLVRCRPEVATSAGSRTGGGASSTAQRAGSTPTGSSPDSLTLDFRSAGGPAPSPDGLTAAATARSPQALEPQAMEPQETRTLAASAIDTDPKTEQSLVVSITPTRAPTERTSTGRPTKTRSQPPRHRWGLIGALAAGAAVVLLSGVLFFLRTKDGFIRVEINDPAIEVSILGTDVVLKQADNGTDVKLSPGDKTLVVERGDFKFETDKLILKKGETVTVHVTLVAGKVEVRQGEQVLGSGQLPNASAPPLAGTSDWQGWPADAPAPAIAPFDAAQARKHQEEWAAHLGVPVEWENSIGMRFVLIPPGEFMMGGTAAEVEEALVVAGGDEDLKNFIRSEVPQHRVALTQPFYLGVYEVTQAQYEQVMGQNPSHFTATGPGKDAVAGMDTSKHPVERTNWNDAAEFCAKLSQLEKLQPSYLRSGETVTLLVGNGYRLPSESQWEFACRAGTTTRYWPGDRDEDLLQVGWFSTNSGNRTHMLGELKANALGLYDVHGNVLEWVQDTWVANYYNQFQEKLALDPAGPSSGDSQRVVRGGRYENYAPASRSSFRHAMVPTYRGSTIGFRVALAAEAVKSAMAKRPTSPKGVTAAWHGWPADAPVPAIAPFDAAQARKYQEEWANYLGVPVQWENSIGMKFVLIPPGKFVMGSTPEEIETALGIATDEYWKAHIRSETPRHHVILTNPIFLGVHEVTQGQYQAVLGDNPSYFAATGLGKKVVAGFDTNSHPVEMVNWYDAAEFCSQLSKAENMKPVDEVSGDDVTRQTRIGYFLPTEAEWEFACRAGTDTIFWTGDQEESFARASWFLSNSDGRTHSVREALPNPFGLYDVHGNVSEWGQDRWGATYYAQFVGNAAIDPPGASVAGSQRTTRGGNWFAPASGCRSSDRLSGDPLRRWNFVGFRAALSVEAVLAELRTASAGPGGSIAAFRSAWHSWPADAPAPAIAPFDAAQARKYQEEWATYLKVPVEWENSIGMKLVLIPPGEFTMGTDDAEIKAGLAASSEEYWNKYIRSEGPRHHVVLTQPFYLGAHEVTQGEYERVMGTNPSFHAPTGEAKDAVAGMDTSRHPVEKVSWFDAAEFCAKLSQLDKLSPYYLRKGETLTFLEGDGYRLPTEAQWEFACRAGTTTRYCTGDADDGLARAGWFVSSSGFRSNAVGQLAANHLGLFDMHGNVWEWVQDWWDLTFYERFREQPAMNPASSAGAEAVIRGGGWGNLASGCMSSHRNAYDPRTANNGVGCRVALPLEAVKASHGPSAVGD